MKKTEKIFRIGAAVLLVLMNLVIIDSAIAAVPPPRPGMDGHGWDWNRDGDVSDPIDDGDGDGQHNSQDPEYDPNVDMDHDGIPNDQDLNLDGDAYDNINDGDVDGDAIDNCNDPDCDNDGIIDEVDNTPYGPGSSTIKWKMRTAIGLKYYGSGVDWMKCEWDEDPPEPPEKARKAWKYTKPKADPFDLGPGRNSIY